MFTKIKELLLRIPLVASSGNKENFSLTLKGAASFLFLFYGWGAVDKEALEGATNELIVLIGNASVLFGEVIAGLSGLYGAGRKILNRVLVIIDIIRRKSA